MIDFDDIKELPVPEEWIATYMDGKLDSATSAFVESNLIDSPEHADFVESLKETWNAPDISMVDFGSSEISLSEASAIDDMDLPSIDGDGLFDSFDTFYNPGFTGMNTPYPSIPSCGDAFAPSDAIGWGTLDENNDIFSHDSDIFSDDSHSLDMDSPDGTDDLSDDL